MTESIADTFDQYFLIQQAITLDEQQAFFKMRYRVYCEEFGYEDRSAFSKEEETDKFDAVSKHIVIIHRASNRVAAGARVVPASLENKKVNRLPMEVYCAPCLDQETLALLASERKSICEISRLAVDPDFRRRPNEKAARYGNMDFDEDEKRVFPLLSVALLMGVNTLALDLGWNYGLAMMESFLPRLLRRSGVELTEAGVSMEYHGTRAPYKIRADVGKNSWNGDLLGLYEAVEAQLHGLSKGFEQVGVKSVS
jgi:N-acyl amino acid synthase of PEP-CTERM/exosortase system